MSPPVFRSAQPIRTLFLLLCLALGSSWAQAQVQTDLRAEKLQKQANGQTTSTSAADARPGDAVVYTASYRNVGKDAVRQLVATVPVPPSMEWQGAGDDKNPPTAASADGVNFAPMPLTRKVRGPDGKEQLQPVPLHEYRALRWTFAELAAGAVATVKVATKVSTNP